MPSRRELIQMRPDEIRAYLDEQRRLILVTNGPDGLPHPVPMNYGIDPDGRIIISAFRKSQKIRNLERDPRAALLVESGESYHQLRSVIAYADAEIVADPEAMLTHMQWMRTSGLVSTPAGSTLDDQIRRSMAKRVAVVFTPFRYLSWDHAKLGSAY